MIAFMRRRVVITGVGMVTPLGNSVEQTGDGMRHGRSGASRITHFDASTLPTQIAAEAKNFRLEDFVEHAERYQHSGRNTRLAIAAATLAMKDSALALNQIDRTRFGVYLGA